MALIAPSSATAMLSPCSSIRPTRKLFACVKVQGSFIGWVLNSVLRREVTLEKADQIETLGFPSQEVPAK